MSAPIRRALATLAVAGLAGSLLLTAPAALAGSEQTWLILYRAGASSRDAGSLVSSAGGSLVANYSQIGVVVARSWSADFGARIETDARVEGASATTGFGIRLDPDAVDGPPPGDLPNVASDSDAEPLWPLQWDMAQINVAQAHAITGGSASILAADLDTGLDFTHPDLAANYDAANSADCSSGVAMPLGAANDQNGHGTHTAGTIAAAANGIGIVGVAPGVRIAGIKSSNDDGFFFPEMVVCAFMWAATHGVDVTNNSYFADPWLFNCRNDPGQRAIWKAEQRAIRYAQSKGVVVVGSAGNENMDLAERNTDTISPDFPPGSEQEREVTNACLRIPAEIPGVVTVTATGDNGDKSFYSDHGVGVVDVAAPGGDSLFQVTAAAPNGRVLSTYPSYRPCTRVVFDAGTGAKYCYLQGTSMAAPHVTGLVALIMSRYDVNAGSAIAILESSATSRACPAGVFREGTAFEAECRGGAGYNSFYGHGEIDALAALSR